MTTYTQALTHAGSEDDIRADERWLSAQRREMIAFNPYTGTPRHPSDIASDPHGILILDPDQPLIRATKPTGGIEP